MLDGLLQDLRARFRETSRIRLDEMRSLLAQLDEDPLDATALKRLATHFHGLAGMGATYGFPEVSRLGDEGEGLILPLVKEERSPDRLILGRWRALVEAIRVEVLGQAG